MQSFIMHTPAGDVSFSANNWSKLFEGNTIDDVYEWVESKYLSSRMEIISRY